MKTILKFIITLIFALFLDFTSAIADEAAHQYNYPDLLGDEMSFDGKSHASFEVSDPLEPMNRVFFEFNDWFHDWLLKPITNVYIWVIPGELRKCFGNFFNNLGMPIRFINTALQGEFRDSGVEFGRFLINSTLGVYGLVDVAALHWGIEPRRADFGQTLGRWGIGNGIYLCWPFIGPSNVRDTVGFVVDMYSHPVPYLHDNTILDVSYLAARRVNAFSLNPDLYEELRDFALDPYIASRQAYYEYRRNFIDQRNN